MQRGTFARYLALVRPHRWRIALGVGLILAATALTLPAPWIIKLIIDDALPRRDVRLLGQLLVAFAALFALRGYLTLVRNRVLQFTAMRVVSDLRVRMFAHLQGLSLRYFDASHTGKVVSRITSDTNEVYQLTNNFLITVVADTVTILGVLVFLYAVEWRLALAITLVLPLFVLNYVYNRRRMRDESRVHRNNWDRVVGFLHERVAAVRVVKSFTREPAETAAFSELIDADYTNYSRIVMRNTRLSVWADILGSVGALLVLGYGGLLVIRGSMAVGTLVAFNAYITFVFPPVVRFVDLSTVLQRAGTAMENIWALLDTEPDVRDRADARALGRINGDVEFRHVNFDYELAPPGDGRPRTLTDVCFRVPAGKVVAVVGASGSGKSTIVNLVARFYEAASGQVLVDGRDVRDVTVNSLREQIGIVLQENVLFAGTLEENIRYGRLSASAEDVRAAAEAANAHGFISALPEGYATVVGERGVKLSGGQRQRIAIARAILRDPRILIFDEATSALDTESERSIQQAMERLERGRTTFVIAHRLSTVRNADLILVMDQGRVVEQGTHAELLARKGVYARLHDTPIEELAA